MKSSRSQLARLFVYAICLIPFAAAWSQSATSYFDLYNLRNQGTFRGGLGYSSIGGDPFVTMHLTPDLAFGKWGVGLDVTLRFNTDTGELRDEDWDEAYDFLRLIRYVRYGQKFNPDPVYARFGSLDGARLGHGFIMNYYRNSLIFDQRKVGIEFDYDFGIGGFESMTSNIGDAEIFGARVYYRPLQLATDIPILRNLTFGLTYATDVDPIEGVPDDNISIFGFDTELPIISNSLVNLALYGDVANMTDYGSGQAVGIELNLSALGGGLFDVGAQLERRFLDPQFIPGYFDPFYELSRGDSSRIKQLLAQTDETRGTYGLLYGNILKTIQLVGSYERLDGIAGSGILHVEANIPDAIPKLAVRGIYDDRNIDTFSDVFKMDENSAARLGIGYKISQYFVFYMDYIWTFRFDEQTQSYKVQRRVEPQLALSFDFPVGNP